MPYKLRQQRRRDRSTGARALMVRHRPRCSQRRESTSRRCGGTTLGATAGPLAPSTYPSAASGGLFPFFLRSATSGSGWRAMVGQRATRMGGRADWYSSGGRGGRRSTGAGSGGHARGGRRSRTHGGGFLRYGVFTESRDDARLKVCKVVIILLIWAV